MKQSSSGYRGGFVVVQGGGGCDDGLGSRVPAGPMPGVDHLEYLSDMIRQMQRMARASNCSTLAGILELASREVDVKRRERPETA